MIEVAASQSKIALFNFVKGKIFKCTGRAGEHSVETSNQSAKSPATSGTYKKETLSSRAQ